MVREILIKAARIPYTAFCSRRQIQQLDRYTITLSSNTAQEK